MSMPSSSPRPKSQHPLTDLIISILIPSIIMMKLSGEEYLGSDGALVLALAFPLGWGILELIRYRSFNWIALLGLVSTMLTGGIGLLRLDTQWLAVKEATVPCLLGVAVLVSTRTRYPLVRTLLYSPQILNIDKIQTHLEQRGVQAVFEQRLLRATYWLSSTFFFSATMNYILAKWLVTSPSGSEAFNAELGQMTLLSYPMIAIPCTLMMLGILYYLWRTIHGLTGLSLEEILAHPPQK